MDAVIALAGFVVGGNDTRTVYYHHRFTITLTPLEQTELQNLVFPWLIDFAAQVSELQGVLNKASANNCLLTLISLSHVLIQDSVHAVATDPRALTSDVVVMHLMGNATFQSLVFRYVEVISTGALNQPRNLLDHISQLLCGHMGQGGPSTAPNQSHFQPIFSKPNLERDPLLDFKAAKDFFSDLSIVNVSDVQQPPLNCTLTNTYF